MEGEEWVMGSRIISELGCIDGKAMRCKNHASEATVNSLYGHPCIEATRSPLKLCHLTTLSGPKGVFTVLCSLYCDLHDLHPIIQTDLHLLANIGALNSFTSASTTIASR